MRIEEYLYAETDDACATCGIRGPQVLTIHHIDEDDSNNAYDNRIVLCYNCHKRYHDNKGITTEQIKDRKRRLILKTLTQQGLNAMKIAARRSFVVATPFLLYHLMDLGYVNESSGPLITMTAGNDESTSCVSMTCFTITEAGRMLLGRWFS